MRFPGFIGPSYRLESVNVDCQRCVNLYPEVSESGSSKEKEVASLVSTPGLSLLVTIGDGPIRGQYKASNGAHYVVSGNKIYSLTSAYAATERGTLSTSTGQVQMADNGTSLVIVDGANGYVVTLSSHAFASITDPDFLGSYHVWYLDGYFLFLDPDTQKLYWSDLLSTDFDALDFVSAEGAPDNAIGLLVDHREAWVFGVSTTEVFYNSGDASSTFQRIQGAFIEYGCAAKFSPAKLKNSVIWLSQDQDGAGVVVRAEGYQPQRISTHAIEHAFRDYDLSSATSWTYQDGGHYFYCLNFSDADVTWVYDLSTGLWHERAYNNQGVEERHRAANHVFVNNAHVVGDYVNGKLYSLSRTTYSDNSAAIIRERTLPHLSASGGNIFYDELHLDVQTGVGLDGTGQGTDPQIMMQYSDDGGHSWSNEKRRELGAIGERKTKVKFKRLGSSEDRVFKVRYSDPTRFVLLGANLKTQVGA